MNIGERLNRKGNKINFYYDYGRGPGQRPSTGVWIHTHPKTQTEKNHNKQALALLEVKKSQMTIDEQATGSGFIPMHKFKSNFLDYYQEYLDLNKRKDSRHLQGSLNHFKTFIKKDVISPIDITENLCTRYRQYLLDRFKGDTPANYFARFKRVLRAATKDGYYRTNPCDDVAAKKNPSANLKENLETYEYLTLINTPFFNQEITEGFIFCCYTGLRYVDVSSLTWEQIKGSKLATRIIQAKTGLPVTLTLHPIPYAILEKRKAARKTEDDKQKIFYLPTNDGSNKALQVWVNRAGIKKHVTWSCARLSFSILLQDNNVDTATVAHLLGHASSEHVNKTYKRHRPKDQSESIGRLPSPDQLPNFLHLK